MTIAACTVVTRNHLAFARLVGRSWVDHHPGRPFTIVVVDHESMPAPTWTHRDIRIIGPDAIGITPDELRTWAAIYDAGELACALKPWVLRQLLAEVEAAVYIDGDVEVLDSMDDLEPLARNHGIVLSPHNLHPFPEDGCLPDRFTMLKAGMYNGGLVAVGRSGTDFLDWWAAQLRRDGIHEPQEGMHGDQRWLDFVPTAFEHHVLRDPTFNVAYWNLHERPSSWDGDSLCVSGRRVRCFHYSGLVDQAPWSLSQFMGDVPRVELRDHPAAARLCRRYLDRLRSAGIETDRRIGYRFAATAGGTPLDRRARRLWRDQLLAAESDPTAESRAPAPFAEDGGQAWLDWLHAPSEGDTVGRYLRRVWAESATLQHTFPRLDDPETRARYVSWAMTSGADAADIPPALLPDPEDVAIAMERAFDPEDRPRRRPPRPDVRAQQPLPDLDAARHTLERSTEPGRGTLQRIADRLLAGRDQRSDEIARRLLDAVTELTQRISELGERVNRVNDDLHEHAERFDRFEDESTQLADVAIRLDTRLDQLAEAIGSEGRRIEGSLEQDAITAGIVADAEARLSAEVLVLERRIDKLSGEAASTVGDPSVVPEAEGHGKADSEPEGRAAE